MLTEATNATDADLNARTPESEFGSVAAALRPEALIELLCERHPVYAGRSENATVRMRGWVLSRLALLSPSSSELLAFVREELETGNHAYSVAAAAIVLRTMAVTPKEWVPLVESALSRLRRRDDALQFDRYPLDGTARTRTTAAAELQQTRTALLRQSEGVVSPGALPLTSLTTLKTFRRHAPISDFELEDHEGRCLSYADFFLGRPSFLIFFYTRCNNPNKCSANVARWGEVQQRLKEESLADRVNLAAITYDPDFDTPARLRFYAEERGVTLNDRARMFRVPDRFDEFQRRFALQVNYSQATVNRHASEALILDRSGSVVRDLVRVTWDVCEVMERLQVAESPAPTTDVFGAD